MGRTRHSVLLEGSADELRALSVRLDGEIRELRGRRLEIARELERRVVDVGSVSRPAAPRRWWRV